MESPSRPVLVRLFHFALAACLGASLSTKAEDSSPPDVRVVLRWDATAGKTTRTVAGRAVESDEELAAAMKDGMANLGAAGKTDAPLLLQGTGEVPWGAMVHAMDVARSAELNRIEFVAVDDPLPAWPGAGEKEGLGDGAPAPGSGKRLVVNVYHQWIDETHRCPTFEAGKTCVESAHWRVNALSRDFLDMETFKTFLEEDSSAYRTDPQWPHSSERKVMIREDARGPYGLASLVMSCCTQVGIYKIECGAASPPSDKPPSVSPKEEPLEEPPQAPIEEPGLRELPPFVVNPPSPEQAEEVARTIEAGYARGDLGPLDEALDRDALLSRSFAGLELSAPLRDMLVKGPFAELGIPEPKGAKQRDWFPISSMYRDLLASCARPHSGLKFLRVRATPEGPRLVFRLTRGLLMDYHEFVLSLTLEGKTRIVDVFIMSCGTHITEAFREPLAASQKGLAVLNSLRAPTPGDIAVIVYEDPVTIMAAKLRDRDYEGACGIFGEHREALAPRRRAHLFRIAAAGQIGAEAHAEALHDARLAFPDDPGIDLAAIAGHLRQFDAEAALQSINDLEEAIGGDPYLEGARMAALLALGRVDEAERRTRDLVATAPDNEIAWLTLLRVAATRGDNADAVAIQEQAERALDGPLELLESTPGLEKYLGSSEYRAWREAHPPK